MQSTVSATIVSALPATVANGAGEVDLAELRDELEHVAAEALDARMREIPLHMAVRDAEHFPDLARFHLSLRDALLMEIPKELRPWAENMASPDPAPEGAIANLQADLFSRARGEEPADRDEGDDQLQAALAELLLFEAVRLRLLVTAWSSIDFESLGGDEDAVDEIAWTEVDATLRDELMDDPGVRPMPVMLAAGSLALARDAAERADVLRTLGEDRREALRMRARLRSALRELRLPESVLLENALAGLLDEDRLDLATLQEQHPTALEGLSRQAMDQRVSRGRRALTRGRDKWPSRRKPALFDLLREDVVDASA